MSVPPSDAQPEAPIWSPKKITAPFVCEWARLIACPSSCVYTPAKVAPGIGEVSAGSTSEPLKTAQLSSSSGDPELEAASVRS